VDGKHPGSPTGVNASTIPLPGGARGSSGSDSRGDGTFEHDSRFVPGAVIGSRYRIVGLLGRGGMGEVYRADDLMLGQPVALKFLPLSLSTDATRLAHFRNEVRTARQVSHPNVCRVYDMGEFEGHYFLSMEFVDGEDLASLLRRIGRLPEDKGLDIARQICAGLAAAHDRGVIHRDLKPSNVMIDGRGHARLTDFGLAAVVDGGAIHQVVGTPAYMAPEQFLGHATSIKSDLYALGLVLYEIFSGQPAFKGSSVRELARLHREFTPSSVSSHVGEINPAVERAIQRCLEKDPAARPSSALALAASLPGGDPLAAALARGETPSPELVAAAADQGVLPTRTAILSVSAALAMLAGVVMLSANLQVTRLVPLPKSPVVLRERATEIARSLGYTDAVDTAAGFTVSEYLRYVGTQVPAGERTRRLRSSEPMAIYYWYRQSPRALTTMRIGSNGRTGPLDPPETISAMTTIFLSADGRLRRFSAVPPQVIEPPPAPPPDWRRLFELAGLDLARFTEVAARWTPPAFADARAAWEGRYPNAPDVPIRVEAAAFAGRPVFFRVVEPWTRPTLMEREPRSRSQRVMGIVLPLVLLGLLGGAAALASRNLRVGRGDRRGAVRLSGVVFFATLTGGLLGADHEAQAPVLLSLMLVNLAQALLVAGFVWLAYIALEPHVRRRWPRTLIAWARLLAGRARDPLVGHDVLAGCVLGIGLRLASLGSELITHRIAASDPVWRLDGFRFALGGLFSQATSAALLGMGILLLLFLVALLTRSHAAAMIAVTLFFAASGAVNSPVPILTAIFGALTTAALLAGLMRFGLLTLVVGIFVATVLNGYPLTLDPGVWFGPTSLLMLAIVVTLALFGFRTSTAGRPVFGSLLGD
jgi:serine/threonine-protein kinase